MSLDIGPRPATRTGTRHQGSTAPCHLFRHPAELRGKGQQELDRYVPCRVLLTERRRASPHATPDTGLARRVCVLSVGLELALAGLFV